MKKFRPMLAATIEDISKLTYPLLATPKIDGIRCVIAADGTARSRSLKLIPNDYIRRCLAGLPPGLDGELVSGNTFQSSASAIMSKDGMPIFQYIVFDAAIFAEKVWYVDRVQYLEHRLNLPVYCMKLIPQPIFSAEELVQYEEDCLVKGYEGVIVRAPRGPYKHGRSTLNEGYLLKLKRFVDAEAVIIGTEELMRNCNTATINALGHTERSSHQASQVPSGLMGSLVVCGVGGQFNGHVFNIGSGFTEAQRSQMWPNGTIVKYKYQPHGVKDLPRSPIFLGIRHSTDM